MSSDNRIHSQLPNQGYHSYGATTAGTAAAASDHLTGMQLDYDQNPYPAEPHSDRYTTSAGPSEPTSAHHHHNHHQDHHQFGPDPHQDSYAQDRQLAGLVQAATAAAAGQGAPSNWSAATNDFAGGVHLPDGYGDAAAAYHHGHFGGGGGGGGVGDAHLHQGTTGVMATEDDAVAANNGRPSKRRKRAVSGGGAGENGGGSGGAAVATTPGRATRSSLRGNRNSMNGPSTSVLFRNPESSSKSTRPKVGSMFRDSELPPEDFLNLKLAAKAYMLDPTHPERRECIGQRNRGDAEIVRLRLHGCVEAFLDEGYGQQFFGPNVNTQLGPERLIDPRDRQAINALLTPILRGALTNERQRLYANATRKGGSSSAKGTPMRNHASSASQSGSPPTAAARALDAASPQSPGASPYAKRSLLNNGGASSSSSAVKPTRSTKAAIESRTTTLPSLSQTADDSPSLRITLISHTSSHRLFPRFSIHPDKARTLDDLRHLIPNHIGTRYGPQAAESLGPGIELSVSVLLDDGRVQVRDENEWTMALMAAGSVPWMDEVVVVVGVAGPGVTAFSANLDGDGVVRQEGDGEGMMLGQRLSTGDIHDDGIVAHEVDGEGGRGTTTTAAAAAAAAAAVAAAAEGHGVS